MPGLYLFAILVSLAGIALLDLRFGLALRPAPGRTAAVVAIGTAFLLAWDAVGIATGVFVKGGSPLYVGIDIAPQLPIEEPVFLMFLSYLALVVWAAALRLLTAPRGRVRPESRELP
ncbi:MAG: lycopene cyclase domain-containing protein [Actinobacteria bacterium]|nr:lycopene cyclase domain-containing protein [Actinomycetota bacterium]